MNAARTTLHVVAAARAAGLVLQLHESGGVHVLGAAETRAVWVDQLRPLKQEVLALLRLELAGQALASFAARHGIHGMQVGPHVTEADLLDALEVLT